MLSLAASGDSLAKGIAFKRSCSQELFQARVQRPTGQTSGTSEPRNGPNRDRDASTTPPGTSE